MKYVNPSACPQCGAVHTAATATDHSDAAPESGSITICINCGSINAVNDSLEIIKLTDEQLNTYEEETQILARRASRVVKMLKAESEIIKLREAMIGDATSAVDGGDEEE